MKKESEDSPDSSDLAGWSRAVEEGRLGSLRPETLLCAVQDWGPDADPRVLNPIAKRLSEIIMRMGGKYAQFVDRGDDGRGHHPKSAEHDDELHRYLQQFAGRQSRHARPRRPAVNHFPREYSGNVFDLNGAKVHPACR